MDNRDVSIPRSSGTYSKQAHADFPPDGIYEREMGRAGFNGPATQLHHRHPPTGWSQWQGPLRPRAFDLVQLQCLTASPWEARGGGGVLAVLPHRPIPILFYLIKYKFIYLLCIFVLLTILQLILVKNIKTNIIFNLSFLP